ncbi:MAG: hypothetical protein ACJAZ1_000076 [Yoonia sp.]|jgi:hypothetical protein
MRHFIFTAAFLGLASPAASSVVTIDLTLRLTAQDWYFYDVYDYETYEKLSTFVTPEADETVYGMSPPLGQRGLGDVISFKATISDDYDKAPTCYLGDYYCGTGSYGYASVRDDNILSISNDGGDFFVITGSMTAGEQIIFDWESGYYSYCEYEVGGTIRWYAMMCGHRSTFTVASSTSVDPATLSTVPLPASMPLLAGALIGAGWF